MVYVYCILDVLDILLCQNVCVLQWKELKNNMRTAHVHLICSYREYVTKSSDANFWFETHSNLQQVNDEPGKICRSILKHWQRNGSDNVAELEKPVWSSVSHIAEQSWWLDSILFTVEMETNWDWPYLIQTTKLPMTANRICPFLY